jgi:hypothetical protein
MKNPRNNSTTPDDHFKPCKYDVLNPDETALEKNPLDKFSLRGKSAELAKEIMAAVFVLIDIALLGQLTVLYAPPNTGKTLFTLFLLIESIKEDRIDPAKVYYLNMDDTINGLLEKLVIAEKYGFHMLSEGYNDFSANKFLATIKSLTESGDARGVIIILDTLKKFTDLMDKRACTEFAKVLRAFALKGGTVIGLAHTNKNADIDGNPIHAGTSDIREDFDCAYIMKIIEGEMDKTVVEFKNIKKRGNVTLSTAYSYSQEQGIPYEDLLWSVEKVDDDQIEPLKQKAEQISDSEITDVIEALINEGINTKMELAKAAAEKTKVSRRYVIQIIDKYTFTGDMDRPRTALWEYEVRGHGAKVYETLY